MPGRKTRSFGTIRRLPSGRWQARYRGPDGALRSAPSTFTRKTDAARWLALTEAELLGGGWIDPDAGRVPFADSLPPGSPNGQACGPRPSSSTATCYAAT